MASDYAKRLDSVLRIIAKRGVQFGDNLRHKHNMLDQNEPSPPFKINLCTNLIRPEARLTKQDIDEIALLLKDFVFRYKLKIPAIAGVPRAGSELANRLQHFLRMDGISIPRVILEKDAAGNCFVASSGGYAKGPLWPVDDLANRGITKNWARTALETHEYSVQAILVVLDYDMGASEHFSKHNIELYSPLSVNAVFAYAENNHESDMPHLEQIKTAWWYLKRERERLKSSRLLARGAFLLEDGEKTPRLASGMNHRHKGGGRPAGRSYSKKISWCRPRKIRRLADGIDGRQILSDFY